MTLYPTLNSVVYEAMYESNNIPKQLKGKRRCQMLNKAHLQLTTMSDKQMSKENQYQNQHREKRIRTPENYSRSYAEKEKETRKEKGKRGKSCKKIKEKKIKKKKWRNGKI